MPARPTARPPEPYPARLLPRRPTDAAVRPGAPPRHRGWVRVALVLCVLASLGHGIWQGGAAGEARSRLAGAERPVRRPAR